MPWPPWAQLIKPGLVHRAHKNLCKPKKGSLSSFPHSSGFPSGAESFGTVWRHFRITAGREGAPGILWAESRAIPEHPVMNAQGSLPQKRVTWPQ